MALPQIFLPAYQRQTIVDIPDERIKPFGGPYRDVAPDVNRSHRELIEYDRRTPTIANLVSYGALSIRKIRQSTTVSSVGSVQFVRHEEITQEDMVWLDSVESSIRDERVGREINDWQKGIQARNLQGCEIMRGYLVASMVVGEIDWRKFGFDFETSTFGMPAEMKVRPSIPLRNAAGVVNVNSTFVNDVADLQRYVTTVKGQARFNRLRMSDEAVRALAQTTLYINQLKANYPQYILANATLTPGTPQYYARVAEVMGLELIVDDSTFEDEDENGNRTSFRYAPERLAVLTRREEEGREDVWEFSKPPMTKQMIAKMGNNATFGGVVGRGPISWGSTEDQQFTGAALYVANEGIPRRHHLYASAVIETRFDL